MQMYFHFPPVLLAHDRMPAHTRASILPIFAWIFVCSSRKRDIFLLKIHFQHSTFASSCHPGPVEGLAKDACARCVNAFTFNASPTSFKLQRTSEFLSFVPFRFANFFSLTPGVFPGAKQLFLFLHKQFHDHPNRPIDNEEVPSQNGERNCSFFVSLYPVFAQPPCRCAASATWVAETYAGRIEYHCFDMHFTPGVRQNV
jgi:hypothetical protein